MLSCKEATRLISASMERKLTLRQRLAVRAHLLMCRFCSRYRRQLHFIEKALSQMVESERKGEAEAPSEASLSIEARERIREAMTREHQGKNP